MTEPTLLLFPKDARELLGVGQTYFYELTQLDTFPDPINPTGKRPVYRRVDIECWIEGQTTVKFERKKRPDQAARLKERQGENKDLKKKAK